MQSSIFRLFSTFITLILFGALIVVIWLVLQNKPQTTPLSVNTIGSTSQTKTAQQRDAATLINTATAGSTADAMTAVVSSTAQQILTTGNSPERPTARATSPATVPTSITHPSSRPTATTVTSFSVLRPTATPTPLKAMHTPLDLAESPASGWSIYTNGNYVNDLTVLNNEIWAATDGGIVSWNRSNNAATKYTILDGLIANRTTAAVNCPLPGFGLIFGTDQGLQLYDSRSDRWTVLNSRNSEMHYDDIATLTCHVDDGFLVVGYRQHGLDIFDVESGEWRLVDQRSGLQNNVVDAVTVVGDLAELWVSSGTGISVLTQDSVLFYDERTTPLETNAINVMTSDINGTVWLGAQGKVYAINGETWTIYSPSYVLASQFPTGAITALTLSDDNTLWIGSDLGELCRFDLVAVTCEPYFTAQDLEITSAITALTVDNLGRLYVGTERNGVRFYANSEERASSGEGSATVGDDMWRVFTVPTKLAGNEIRALTQDTAGYLWLLTEAGLHQLNPLDMNESLLFTELNSRYAIDTIQILTADPLQGLWVGGVNAGYFDGVGWTNFATTDGLVNRNLRAIAVDNAQRTWFGTEDGLSIWNGDSFFNLTQADGLPGTTINTFFIDGEEIWIGTERGLLRFADNRLQVFTMATTRLPSDVITALARDEDGALLIGTSEGLARFLEPTMSNVPEFERQSIVALNVLPGNAIWVATATQGVRYFNGLNWVAPPGNVLPTAQSVDTLFVDQQGALWLGTDGGLLRYVP